MTVVTRSAAKKKLSATTPPSPPLTRRTTNTPKPKARTIARPSRVHNEGPSSSTTTTNTGLRTTLIDSSGAVVTVAPSATGQGVHTRWTYGTAQDVQMTEEAEDITLTTNSASPSPSSTPPPSNARYVTPAPRESFYPSTALCTPQKGARAKIMRRSPRRVSALAPEVLVGNQRYHRAMGVALNRTNDGEYSNMNVLLPTPSKQTQRDVFAKGAQTGVPKAGPLGQPVSLQRTPLGRYDTIQWDAGCGETPVTSPKTGAESPKRRSPLVRSLDSGPGPLLGPMGTQIIGPNGTHLLLGATAGPILDTQIIEENDSMMDITMDEGGHLKGPIGPNGEKLGRDGKQLLGPSGTLLHYDINRLADKLRDGRAEAKGFLGGSPSRARRLGPSGKALLE
ncbi:hypothetical protein EYR40_005768 [Pleurotus pulmonarius]|nr:hypothetical protein EYR40_005768 [Pleurotus pulmonarius]